MIALLMGVVFVAHAVETTVGFGATVIALAVGSHVVGMREWMGVLVVLSMVQSLWIVGCGVQHVQWRTLVSRILPLAALGLPLGLWLGATCNTSGLKIAFAVFVGALAIAGVCWRGRSLEAPWLGWTCLVGGGIAHGLFATGGPLVVVYANRAIQDKAQFRATLAVFWLILNAAVMTSLALRREVRSQTLYDASLLLPAVAAGIWAGGYLHKRVSEERFRLLVHGLLLIGAGLMLL